MIDGELIRLMRTEISKQLNIILSGRSINSSTQTEDIEEMFPGMPTITQRPVMHPFGLSSAAPDGIISVVAKQGADIQNRIILGHRDKGAPDVVKGETVLYDQFGGIIQLRTAGMEITKNDISLLAEQINLLETLIKLLTTIINARTNTIFGPQPLIPDPIGAPNGELFTSLRDVFTEIKDRMTTMKGGVGGN